MLRSGLSSASLRDIAVEAKVSIGTVSYHFRSVNEILQAVVTNESQGFYAQAVERARAAPDPRDGIRILMEPLFGDHASTVEHWKIWADYWGFVGRRPEIAEPYAQQIRVWEHCCTEVIEAGSAAGVFAEVPARETAVKLAAYSDGIGIQMAQAVPSLDSAQALRWMLEFAGHLLRCDLRADAPAPPAATVE